MSARCPHHEIEALSRAFGPQVTAPVVALSAPSGGRLGAVTWLPKGIHSSGFRTS